MRHTVSTLLTTAGLSLAAISVGAAADLGARPVYKAPPIVAPVYNWTGCYLGANAGGIWGTSNIDIPGYPSNFDIKSSSFIGGGQLGCNYQAQQFVFGIEGNWDWMDLSGDGATGGAAAERFHVRWNWDATVRGRLGYAFAGTPWLLYITGGVAWANLDNANFIPGLAVTAAQSGTHSGWTFGGGVEYQFTANWIAGLEYRHSEYGSKRYQYVGPVDVDLKTDAVMARLSYLFRM